ncbi:hypothetical protein T4E_11512 [Trichinella pseudospiralis]|uniref:Uncharacterized protein n=1 Tax=Trichinella pseudospiralis TaxID=6337 RepID=A0A0V0YJ02_TRIPS|nr:hypothetical protein T4E_11512 [Trichinella pseudospiralis]
MVLASRRTWGMDSTFKDFPQWYQQPFTIHVFVAGTLAAAVYGLCTILRVNLNPQTICDFEIAP